MIGARREHTDRWLAAAAAVGLLATACATPASDGVQAETKAPATVTATTAEAEAVQAPEPAGTSVAAEPAAAEPTDAATAVDEQSDREFVVTEEVYEQTFAEIEALIAHLNSIIRERDFIAWFEFLTPEYVVASSDPQYLSRLEQSRPLRRKNIELRGLEDFFTHVVVPSRSDAVLDSVEFVDEDRVKAISLTSVGPGVLYFLVRSVKGWQISVF